MNMVCPGEGMRVHRIDSDHWVISHQEGDREERLHIDFTRLPRPVRLWWRVVLTRALEEDSFRQVSQIWWTAPWFCRFLVEREMITIHLDELTVVDWGAYAEYLESAKSPNSGRPLALDSRRAQFHALYTAIYHAVQLRLVGVSHTTLDRLDQVAPRVSRGYGGMVRRRTTQRALDGRQYDEIYRAMRQEWQLYLRGRRGRHELR